jgi:hypothetical protein
MKNALISPNEQVSYISAWDGQTPVYTVLGQRVAQVADAQFEVAPPLFWLECADDVTAMDFYYNATSQAIVQIPESPPQPTPVVPEQPVTTGSQTL